MQVDPRTSTSEGSISRVKPSALGGTRVVHLITSLDTGGAEMMLFKLLTQSAIRDASVLVVSLKGFGRVARMIEALGVPVISIGLQPGIGFFGKLRMLRRILRDSRATVIHSWMYHANVIAQLIGQSSVGRARIRLITSVRASLEAPKSHKLATRIVRWIDAKLSARADIIIFNSSISAAQHGEFGYQTHKSRVIPNGFDIAKFSPSESQRKESRIAWGVDDNLPVIALVARFHPVKGHVVFLEAASRLVRSNTNCRFLLVGGGCEASNKKLQVQVEQLGLKSFVHLLGEQEDIALIHNGSDVSVSASFSESFPNAIGEAMSCGVPCVVTNVGDCAMLVGPTGLIVPPGDPESLAQAIRQLVEIGRAGRLTLGTAARQRIEQDFSLERIARDYFATYEDSTNSARIMSRQTF